MSDMDTTRDDGAACECCGADAVWMPEVMTGGTRAVTPLCGECSDHQTTLCPTCHRRIWQQDGVRIFCSGDLYCAPCAAEHPGLIRGREAASRADVDRDDDVRRG